MFQDSNLSIIRNVSEVKGESVSKSLDCVTLVSTHNQRQIRIL